MRYIPLFMVAAILFLAGCAALDPGNPVLQAQADRITIEANTEADMKVKRQQEVFAEDNLAAQTKAQTDLLDAQTRANTAPLVIAGWVCVALGFMTCTTILAMFIVSRRPVAQARELPRASAPVCIIDPRLRRPSLPEPSGYPVEVFYENNETADR